jgi:hypothetical protein
MVSPSYGICTESRARVSVRSVFDFRRRAWTFRGRLGKRRSMREDTFGELPGIEFKSRDANSKPRRLIPKALCLLDAEIGVGNLMHVTVAYTLCLCIDIF